MKILITGGTHGMGKGVAKILAGADQHRHEIIILCRSKNAGEATIKEIAKTTLNNHISYVLCDLTKFSEVKNVIHEIHEKHQYLDGLFINAGLGYASQRLETAHGLDAHFQVNYLAQFMLTLNLIDLLEKSPGGGRVIFNVTRGGQIFWDDLQLINLWSYEKAIHQAMVAKRMFLAKLHRLYQETSAPGIAFIGFEIPKPVWTNQLNIIPASMRLMATIMKLFGRFISIDRCGQIMAPLFTENQEDSLKKSGKLITWKKNKFVEIPEDAQALNQLQQDKLWRMSMDLCGDKHTIDLAHNLESKNVLAIKI